MLVYDYSLESQNAALTRYNVVVDLYLLPAFISAASKHKIIPSLSR